MNCNLSVNIYINFKYNASLTRTGNFLALGDACDNMSQYFVFFLVHD